MFVTPLPAHGDIVVGRDAAGRVLRVSGHPELDRVVLSIWQEGRCLATIRLAEADVPDLVRILTAAVVAPGAGSGQAAVPPAGYSQTVVPPRAGYSQAG
jgi:hypothetical protein